MIPPVDTARLLVSCPDRHGIVAAVAGFLAESGANIVMSDQYSTDPEGGRFFLRMECHLDGLDSNRTVVERQLDDAVDHLEILKLHSALTRPWRQ